MSTIRPPMALPLNRFAAAAAHTVAKALEMDPELFQVGSPPKPEMGDFAVGCFPAAKALKAAPPALAKRVVEAFTPGEELIEATAAGPFVNFRANRESVFRHLFAAALGGEGAPELIPTAEGRGKTICIDFSSPNISKHLAYHHIRSTVLGHALVLLYRALGYRVIGINHLGDWGTTHGMLLAAYKKWHDGSELSVEHLNQLYVKFRAAMKEDPNLEEEGRAWFKKLEDGDPEARQLWEEFRQVSLAEFNLVYDLLGIEFDEVRGESDYVGDMPAVLDLLARKNLSSESEGALVVSLEEENMPPLLLKKQDGATLYATRDLAAALYRWNTYEFARSLYVVDRGQGLHFKQLFRTLEKAGFDWASRCSHIPFGLVRIGGKKTGTRTGNVVLLKEVLAEAQERSSQRIAEQNPQMSPEKLAETARAVGIGAVVFANLQSQREKDVDFSWEEILSWSGDAAPYVQYSHARSAKMLRDADGITPGPDADAALLTHDLEWALARRLSDFPDAVARATHTEEPHHLARYLLDLCADFSRWYTEGKREPSLRVLGGDAATGKARLTLVAVTRELLSRGLGLLGCQAPDVM